MKKYLQKTLQGLAPEGITSLCLDKELTDETFNSIEWMEPFQALEDFSCAGHELETINEIARAINLQKLTLSYNKIEDISALNSLLKLTFLDLSFNQLRQIVPLESLKALEELRWNLTALQI